MRKILLLATLIVITYNVQSQRNLDYNKYKKDNNGLSCTNVNQTNVDTSFAMLNKIDTNTISNGLDEYFHDLAMTTSLFGIFHKDKWKEYSYVAIKYFERSIQLNPNDPSNYYEIIYTCMTLNDYKTAKVYVEPYEKLTPLEYREKYITEWIEKNRKE